MACAGVLALIFGTWQINHNIKAPFTFKPIDKSLLGGNQTPDFTKDTDGDGLADYEEINIYHTSPYLADTDSDGIPDGVEVRNGTDPLCPEGKVCGTDQIIKPSSASSSLVNPPMAASISAPNISAAVPADLTAGQIREALKQGGVSEADLKKLDDKTIMELYQQAASQAASGQ